MCGIVGIIELADKSPDANVLQEMNRPIQHRGPDDKGYFIDKNIGFAHSRLSILDLSSNGHQPMLSPDEDFIIIFNGEIYNHLDIRKQLKGNHNYKSHSDTETILYGFIELGEKIFSLLNGFFAVAIYHKVDKTNSF